MFWVHELFNASLMPFCPKGVFVASAQLLQSLVPGEFPVVFVPVQANCPPVRRLPDSVNFNDAGSVVAPKVVKSSAPVVGAPKIPEKTG